MLKWLKSLGQISPRKGPEDLGAPIPVLDPKNNPFAKDHLDDDDVRARSDN